MTLKIFISLLSFSFLAQAQTQNRDSLTIADNFDFRIELNNQFQDSLESPLKENDRLSFSHLEFFELKLEYAVLAKIEVIDSAKPFMMSTTTGRKAIYQKYARAHFTLKGEEHFLYLYQSHRLLQKGGYEDYLFLPFTDLSNGSESYGGGRFIDLRIPAGDSLLIDFNKAYNPYCAYNSRYSCPIPPKENHLNIKALAGTKAPQAH
jgi:uncharacterized protein (DUF1684 family)